MTTSPHTRSLFNGPQEQLGLHTWFLRRATADSGAEKLHGSMSPASAVSHKFSERRRFTTSQETNVEIGL
ncbi:uncharacterized [Tachysurus ichikawai]